jgi:hypothetical protein
MGVMQMLDQLDRRVFRPDQRPLTDPRKRRALRLSVYAYACTAVIAAVLASTVNSLFYVFCGSTAGVALGLGIRLYRSRDLTANIQRVQR